MHQPVFILYSGLQHHYSDKGSPPPGVVVAARRMMIDPNDEPQYAERIPYVITQGEPGTLLAERAIDPLQMISKS